MMNKINMDTPKLCTLCTKRFGFGKEEATVSPF